MTASRATNSGRKRTTIKDVAHMADVSISTVSLVMNNKGAVSEVTRGKVIRAAEELGYVSTQTPRKSAAPRTGNVGFIVRDDHFTRSEPFYTHIYLGTEFEARHQGVYVLLSTVRRDYESSRDFPRFLRKRNVDGLIVAGMVSPDFLEDVDATGIPVVTVDFESADYPSVVIDNLLGGRQAVTHLLERGHRRIAYLGADVTHPSLRARQEGYRLALNAAGVTLDGELELTIPEEEPTRRTGAVLAERLLALNPRPTAAFCANDAVALGVIDHLRAACLQVPDDLAVVGFDDVDGAMTSKPPLTTMRVFKEQLGELALGYLTDLIERVADPERAYDRNPHIVKVAAELIVRQST